MKIFIIILMFVFTIYMADTIKTANSKETAFTKVSAAYYFSMATITVVYLGLCTFLVWFFR